MAGGTKSWCSPEDQQYPGSLRCCGDVTLPSTDLYIIENQGAPAPTAPKEGAETGGGVGGGSGSGSGSGSSSGSSSGSGVAAVKVDSNISTSTSTSTGTGTGTNGGAGTDTDSEDFQNGDDRTSNSTGGSANGDSDNLSLSVGSLAALIVIILCVAAVGVVLARRYTDRREEHELAPTLVAPTASSSLHHTHTIHHAISDGGKVPTAAEDEGLRREATVRRESTFRPQATLRRESNLRREATARRKSSFAEPSFTMSESSFVENSPQVQQPIRASNILNATVRRTSLALQPSVGARQWVDLGQFTPAGRRDSHV
jgi:hypothetical protein